MERDEFWGLIESVAKDPSTMEERVKAMSEAELVDFYWLYQDKIDELMEEEFQEVFGDDYSEGHHEDIATWVVRQGKAYYEGVVDDPASLPTELPKNTGTSYQGLVTRKYNARYGKPMRDQDDPPPASA